MIEREILSLLVKGEKPALVTIIDKSGSAPRLPGSKMIITDKGLVHGSIGGGLLEHTACKAAREVLKHGRPQILEFDLRGTDREADMVCGGMQLVLIERITPAMHSLFENALACLEKGGTGFWLIDITRPDTPLRAFFDLETDSPPDNDIDWQALLRRRNTCLVRESGQMLVIDPLPRSGTVVLFGGGHISREVARLAAHVDFQVVVCDDREEFAHPARFPEARAVHVVHEFRDLADIISCREECYLLILTRGHLYDQEVLGQALRTPARYIGMIGSRKKRDLVYANLRSQGFTKADFARVHCPIGTDIGSETPREIGISIVGELIAARAGSLDQ